MGTRIYVINPEGYAGEICNRYGIHIGEAESILLARELDADLLLINERDGRRAAKNAGVKVKGTIGVISDCIERHILTVGVVGSTLSIGSRTRFWIMRIQRERHGTVREWGAHPAVLCGVGGGFRIFIESLPRYSRKAYMGCVLILRAWVAENSARHFHTSRSGAVKVSGHHPVFMATVRSWMGGCGEIHTESGEAKCEIAMYRFRT